MNAVQKQVIESFVRVRAFLEAHPVTGELTYGGAKETVDEVIDRFWVHAGTQLSGRALGRAEVRRQEHLIRRLRDRHMRPIVTIARAQVEPHSDVRLPVAVRMPKVRIGVTKMIQACDGMMEAARAFEALLIENGLPSDFLSRFKSDRDELELTCARRATMTGTHVGARKGLQVVLARGRLAVDRLDAVVRVAFEGDEVVLATWRATKRVRQRPGGSSAQAPVGEDAREQLSEEVPQPIPVAIPIPRLAMPSHLLRRPRRASVRLALGLALGLAPGFCLTSDLAAQGVDPVQEIRTARARSNAAIARHDTAAIAREWMPDMHVVSSTSAQGAGANANASRMAETFARRPDTKWVRAAEDIEVFDAWHVASERGTWVGTWTEPDGPVRISGTYQAQWRRVGGAWRIQAELFVPLRCSGSAYCARRP